MDTFRINVLVLAYLGDTIYEDYIRLYLINQGINNVNDLQKEAVNYVSAKNQARFLQMLLDKKYFSEDEMSVILRARNHKSHKHPRNTDIITYKYSTAFEALIGYLKLNNNEKRIDEIVKEILFNCKEDIC